MIYARIVLTCCYPCILITITDFRIKQENSFLLSKGNKNDKNKTKMIDCQLN